jgi:2,4-dienoyl-CoA reductase-like NADH-dependent reductase (Old Yellow Enzyme family)
MGDPILFQPLKLCDVQFRNRIVVSPMCQYSAEDGFASDWHLVHLGSRVIGGAGTVIVEATAVEERGRISPGDLGIWKDPQIEALLRITRFCREHGSVPAIQLAHAGRKASTDAPWRGGHPVSIDEGGWEPVAPSSVPFDKNYAVPHELSREEIKGIIQSFATSAVRAREAGFQVIEIHGAHGYLLNEFLSPLSNRRTDEYGGSFENRVRFVREIVEAVRKVWPASFPLFLRVSATDWAEGGWTLQDSIELVRLVAPLGVDLIDCSSGGLVPYAKIEVKPGYQVPFADTIRKETGVPTGAVGLITAPEQAEKVLQDGSADLVVIAREFLRDPYWSIRAASTLGVPAVVPVQYQRAFPNSRTQASQS